MSGFSLLQISWRLYMLGRPETSFKARPLQFKTKKAFALLCFRARALPHVQRAGLRDALGFGHAYAAVRGGEILGVAAWLPPGAFPLSGRRQLRAVPDMVRILAAAPRSIPRLMRFMASVNALHPAQPYWYLEVVDVEPAVQGLGISPRLLEPVLSRADEAGQPCYLETMTERNVTWYRGLGFEVRHAGVSFTRDGPRNWTMLRLPRQLNDGA